MIPGLPETGIGDVAARAGIHPELISIVVALVAPRLVSPLAAVWKRWRKTSGPDTRAIIKLLTALIVGLGGFTLGLYGYDLRGVVNAVMAAVLTYFKTTGEYDRDVQVRVKADRVGQQSVPASDAPERPASAADVEAELMRQTGVWPAVPGIEELSRYERGG